MNAGELPDLRRSTMDGDRWVAEEIRMAGKRVDQEQEDGNGLFGGGTAIAKRVAGGAGSNGNGNGTGSGFAAPPGGGEDGANLQELAQTRYLNYALSVITSRALPDVRDGM